jgi:hypothetical protein
MRPVSSGNSRPALAWNLTPPRNLSPSLRLHFYAPNSACRVNCGIAAWIKLLKSDPRAIFTAASKASQAATYLRSFSEARNEVPCLG